MEGEYRLEWRAAKCCELADRIIAATLAEQSQLEFLYHADTGARL